MTTLAIAIGLVLLVPLLRMNVSFFLLALLQLSLIYVGLVIFEARGEALPSTPVIFGIACLLFVTGYALMFSLLGRRRFSSPDGALIAMRQGGIMAIVLFAGVLGSYHLLVSGIPIFSSGIERARFDFTSSGFFGLPGRMYILGTTIAWIFSAVDAHYRGVRWRDDLAWKIATVFVVVHAALSGFKGELLSTVLLFVGMYVAITGSRLSLGTLARRGWWAIVGGVAYFYVIATLYTTYSTVDKPLYVQLLDRATTGGAQAGAIVLEKRLYFGMDSPIVNDFRFLALKYTGQSPGDLYTFDRLVSTQINGTTPTSSAFAPPVTMGGFPEMSYNSGALVALLVMVAVGAMFAYFDRRSSRSTAVRTAQLTVVLAIYTWILKGSLAYVVLNHLAVFAILFMVGLCGSLITKPSSLGGKDLYLKSGSL